MKIETIQKILKRHLDEHRYQHTLGVMYTCAALAMKEGVSIEDAMIAGLLHDCAKCISDSKKLKLCKKYKIELSLVEQNNPALTHAKLGAFFAKTRYGVRNHEILNAITYHTTGRPEMSTLEKIVYMADSIEPHRTKIILGEARELAFKDLDLATYKVLEKTLYFLNRNGREVDAMTQKTFLYYKDIIERRNR